MQIRKWWSGVQESYYVGDNYSEGRWWFKWYCAFYAAVGWQRVLFLMCKVLGHKWESDDYGTPESGYMGVHCERCGESHGTQLY